MARWDVSTRTGPLGWSGRPRHGCHEDSVLTSSPLAERKAYVVSDTTGEGLEVENLVVRYGGHTAVNGISLSAPAGRVTGLIGPNGAGKTSTFNACTGLL